MQTNTILFLYREIMPYNLPVIMELVKQNFKIIVIHDTKKKLTPFLPSVIENVIFIDNYNYTHKKLLKFAESIAPSIVYVSDRTNSTYNYVTIILRKKYNIPVISGCDSQWRGGKQWVNIFTSFMRHKRYFSHILVAGLRQFEYAKRLGFSNDKVLWPMYSADTNLFHQNNIELKNFEKPCNFLFAGRFAKTKGIHYLIEAWTNLSNKNGATLTLVGNGPLKDKFAYGNDIILYDFLPQIELMKLANKSTCFILPSIFEPWALVIHEFAAAGLPMIVTNACGATPHFVLNNYNGFVINPGSTLELVEAMEKIINMEPERLFEFALRSRELSRSITPKMVAHAITSVL